MAKRNTRRVEKSGEKPSMKDSGEDKEMEKKACKAEDAEEAKEEKEEEAEEEDEEAEEEEEKSLLSEDDLKKSLQKLEQLASTETPTSRKEALLSKAMKEDLSQEEQGELMAILGGEKDPSSLSGQVSKSLSAEENDSISKAIDVSDFLAELYTGLTKSLSTVAESVEKSQNRQHEYNVVLAKSILDMGRLVHNQAEIIKNFGTRVEAVEKTPARGPKSKMINGYVEKAFVDQDPRAPHLNKSQILNGLEEMFFKSVQDGRGGASASGEDLHSAIATYENAGQISQTLMNEVLAHARGKAVR